MQLEGKLHESTTFVLHLGKKELLGSISKEKAVKVAGIYSDDGMAI